MLGSVLGTAYISGGGVYSPRTAVPRGLPCWPVGVTMVARGINRGIADASLTGYLLYVGDDGGTEPDTTDTPAATGATLPLDVELADGTYRVLLRARNAYGVESQNTKSTLVVIDSAESAEAPPGGLDSLVVTASGYSVRVVARYLEDSERSTPTVWRVVLEQDGEDDQIFTETIETVDVEGEAQLADGVARVDVTFTAVADVGTLTISARVESAAGDGPYSTATVAVPGTGISAVNGYLGDPATGGKWDRSS